VEDGRALANRGELLEHDELTHREAVSRLIPRR
jgi:hypothetical protein